jgi:hypothetical protein
MVKDAVAAEIGDVPPSSPWGRRQHGPPKHWYPITSLHGVTTQKTTTYYQSNEEIGGGGGAEYGEMVVAALFQGTNPELNVVELRNAAKTSW